MVAHDNTNNKFSFCVYQPVLSLEILVASDFDKVVGTAIYYPQYHYM